MKSAAASSSPARRHLAGHILEHVTLELQNLAGMPGGFGKARETNVRGVYKVVVRARHETSPAPPSSPPATW
jgi:hypothetical protein